MPQRPRLRPAACRAAPSGGRHGTAGPGEGMPTPGSADWGPMTATSAPAAQRQPGGVVMRECRYIQVQSGEYRWMQYESQQQQQRRRRLMLMMLMMLMLTCHTVHTLGAAALHAKSCSAGDTSSPLSDVPLLLCRLSAMPSSGPPCSAMGTSPDNGTCRCKFRDTWDIHPAHTWW